MNHFKNEVAKIDAINEQDSVCEWKTSDKQAVLHRGFVFYAIRVHEFIGKEKIMP